jgi:SOS-response transcriptional repressors (RecA-mediated autopeptidases)
MNTLRALRDAKGVSQQDVADYLGLSRQAYNFYENDKREASYEMLLKMAEYFGTTVDYLLNRTEGNVIPYSYGSNPDILRIPVYGTIPAGAAIEAIEDILDIEEAPADWSRGGKEYFALKIKGDSMSPTYLDGDVIIFLKTSICDSGSDCCVMTNGDDATFKRVYISERGITLQPLNPDFEPMFFAPKEVENLPVTILGVVKELRRIL